MSEQEKRCSAYLRTWVKRKRCSYKAVKNGRCRRHQEKNAVVSPQPAIEGDVVERVAEAIRKAVYPSRPFSQVESVKCSRAAIAAMQPIIDKAVAEERAQCVGVCRNISTNLFEASSDKAAADFIIKAIEQGGA